MRMRDRIRIRAGAGSTPSSYREFDLFMLVGESGVLSTRKGEVLPVTRRFRELLA